MTDQLIPPSAPPHAPAPQAGTAVIARAPVITPALCQRCGACCSQVVDGELVACRHLAVAGGRYRCTIYEVRPPVCRDYTCVRDGELSPAVADRVLDALKEAA